MGIKATANIVKRMPYIDNIVLSAGAAQCIEIPNGKVGVGFGADADFYCKVGDSSVTAVIPTASIIDGSGSMFNPTEFQFIDGDTHISLVSAFDCIVTLTFF